MSEFTHTANVQLPPDLVVPGMESAYKDAAGNVAYPPVSQTKGMELGWENSPRPADAALDYTSHLFSKDRTELTVLSDRWSSSVVLEDAPTSNEPNGPPKVYKVFRQACHYGYVENEMAALTVLHDLDLAPQPYLLVDAGMQYRASGESDSSTFPDVPITRQDLGGDLPIIIMDKVEQEPLEVMSDEQLASEFMRVLHAGIEHELSFADTELVYDRNKKHVTFIDLGGVKHLDSSRLRYVLDDDKLVDAYPDMRDEEILTARVATDVLRHFLRDRIAMDEREVQRFIGEQGLDALSRPLLYHFRNTPQDARPNLPNSWQPTQSSP